MKTEGKLATDATQVTKKNLIVMSVGAGLFVLLLAASAYKWYAWGYRNPIEIFINVMFLFVLVERAQARYIVQMDKAVLRFTKKNLLGSTVHEVPYKEIFGIYRYKAQLVRAVKFRRTYRLNSALDNRSVWVLAYRALGKKGKMENRRIYFKTSEAMLDALAEKLPNKVRANEEQVAVELLKAEPDWDKK